MRPIDTAGSAAARSATHKPPAVTPFSAFSAFGAFGAFGVVLLALVSALAVEMALAGHRQAGAMDPSGSGADSGRESAPDSDSVSIGGILTFSNGDPAAGAVVDLHTGAIGSGERPLLRSAVTEETGSYRFDELPADCYQLVLRAPSGAAFDGGGATAEHDICLDPGQSDPSIDDVLLSGRPAPPFTLTVLHIGDHHSRLSGQLLELDLGDAEPVEVDVGGMARVATKINERAAVLESAPRSASNPQSVVRIHTGDSLAGTIMYTVFGGAADAAAMNGVCFDLLGIGRQDLANGQEKLDVFLDFLSDGPCRSDIVSADLEPGRSSVDRTVGQTTARRFGDGLVGFVAVPNLDSTADPAALLAADALAGLSATTQAGIDRLLERGIASIVLISNIGLANDLALAETLTAVDAIVGGGSHSLLGDFSVLGLDVAGDYPQQTVNLDGEPVCIGHAWKYALVVGELRLAFDGEGGLAECGGEAHLLLSTVAEDPVTASTIDGYTKALGELSREPLATVTEELCYTPVPSRSVGILCTADVIGDGVRRPADIQLLIAEAIRHLGQGADIGVVNSGVVDRGLPSGPLRIDDAYRVLVGDQTVSFLEMTGSEIEATLEEAIRSALADDGSRRAYPHVAGLRWTFDPAGPSGARMIDLEVSPGGDAPWTPLDRAEVYTVATTGFLAGGGDGYATMAAVSADGRSTRTFVEYSQALVDYIELDLGGVVSPLGEPGPTD